MRIKQMLRLYTKGKSKSYISENLGVSRNTIAKYISIFDTTGLSYCMLKKMTDIELISLFEPSIKELSPRREHLQEEFKSLDKYLKKPGSTRLNYWEDYCTRNPDAYSYSRFCRSFSNWLKRTNPSLHIEHKAGDKMYIDFTGKKLQIVDKVTGEIKPVEVFVSVLGCSQMTYVEAVMSQKKEDFIQCVENSMWFYDGVPEAIVPDNLRSAVKKADRYEPQLNETFEDFALHYQTHVLPARVRKPKDKSLVEGAVKIIYHRIYRHLRKKVFYSLQELNKEILDLLQIYNTINFRGKDYSRNDVFVDLEKHYLLPLPKEKYEIRKYALGTVHKNCHVYLSADKHYYSVPYQYIGKKIKIKYTTNSVWIYHNYEEIAIHTRDKTRYGYTTIKEHLPSSHQYITDWNPKYFIEWAEAIGPKTSELIQHILNRKRYPEQNYKSSMGVLYLEKKVGQDRLENACSRALDYKIFNYNIVKRILVKKLDLMDDKQLEVNLPHHNNIRGNNYYQ